MVLFMFALTHTSCYVFFLRFSFMNSINLGSVWIVTLINLIVFLYALTLMIKDLRGQELGRVQSSQSPSECQLEGLSENAD